jgi:hypothetical protein
VLGGGARRLQLLDRRTPLRSAHRGRGDVVTGPVDHERHRLDDITDRTTDDSHTHGAPDNEGDRPHHAPNHDLCSCDDGYHGTGDHDHHARLVVDQ